MFEDRRKRSTLLTVTYCERCEAISLANGAIPRDCIKNALKRLEMYPKEKDGKNSKI